MTSVDPYIVRIPEKFVNPDGTPTPELLGWFNYDNRWKHDLWKAFTDGTGQGVSGIPNADANENQIRMIMGAISKVFKRPYRHTVSSSYTTIGDEEIKATAACVITLGAPGKVEVIHSASNGVFVDVTDGTGTIRLFLNQSRLKFKYSVEFGWEVAA